MNLLSNFSGKNCIYCNSNKIYIVQLRKNKFNTKKIYLCRDCSRRFTPDDGFKGFRHPPFAIKTTIRLIQNNLSLGQIVYNLNQNFRIKVSRKTILDWKKRFLIEGR